MAVTLGSLTEQRHGAITHRAALGRLTLGFLIARGHPRSSRSQDGTIGARTPRNGGARGLFGTLGRWRRSCRHGADGGARVGVICRLDHRAEPVGIAIVRPG